MCMVIELGIRNLYGKNIFLGLPHNSPLLWHLHGSLFHKALVGYPTWPYKCKYRNFLTNALKSYQNKDKHCPSDNKEILANSFLG